MGKAIVWALLILVAFGGYTWIAYRVGALRENSRIIKDGGAGIQGVTLLKEAREIFRELTEPSSILRADGSYDMLTERTTNKVEAWLQAFNKWRGKGTVR